MLPHEHVHHMRAVRLLARKPGKLGIGIAAVLVGAARWVACNPLQSSSPIWAVVEGDAKEFEAVAGNPTASSRKSVPLTGIGCLPWFWSQIPRTRVVIEPFPAT